MNGDLGLALARAVHFAATAGLFGASLFPVYGRRPVLRRWMIGAVVLALASGAAWFLLAAAQMSGSDPAMVDGATLALVAATGFGRLWIGRAVLAVLLLGWLQGRRSAHALPWMTGVLLATLALTGHARSQPGVVGAVHVAADAAHLLAAGVWLGGLVALGHALRGPAPDHGPDERAAMLGRFSGVGYGAVAVLLASGAINGWLMLGSAQALVSTAYGRLLGLKLALVAAMLCLAAANRLWITPGLARASGVEAVPWLVRIRRHVLAEQALGAAVLAVVGLLGTMDPLG